MFTPQVAFLIVQLVGTFIGIITMTPAILRLRRDRRNRDDEIVALRHRDEELRQGWIAESTAHGIARGQRDVWIRKHGEALVEIENFRTVVVSLGRGGEELRAKVAELEAKIARLSVDLVEAKRTNESLQGEIADRDQAIAALEADRDSSKRKFDGASFEIDAIRDSRDEWKRKHDEALVEIEELRTVRDELQVQVEALEAKIARFTADLAEAKRTNESLQGEIADRDQAIATLKTDRDFWKSKAHEYENAIGDLNRTLKEIEQDRDEWKEKHDRAVAANSFEAANAANRIKKLDAERKRWRTRFARLNQSYGKIVAEIKDASVKVEAERALGGQKLQQLSGDLENLKDDNTKLLRKVKYRNRRLAEARRRTRELEARCDEQRQRLLEFSPPAPHVPIPNSAKVVTIGLDFGTHSTKVVVRGRGEAEGWVVRWDFPTAGMPSFASPVVVRQHEGKLYFGRDAMGLNVLSGLLYRNLKADVCRDGREKKAAQASESAVLTAIYLAWVLGCVRKRLDPNRDPDSVRVNLGAPMSLYDRSDLEMFYLRIVNAAYLATFGPDPIAVEQRADFGQMRSTFRDLLAADVPSLEDPSRRVDVWPETIAPLTSLDRDPVARRPGLYLMLDMGAGTTECSMCRISNGDADRDIFCFEGRTNQLGANCFHDNDEANAFDDERHANVERSLIESLRKTNREIWTKGFDIERADGLAARQRWAALNVLLVGGGMHRKSLVEAVKAKSNSPPAHIFVPNDVDLRVRWRSPCGLYCAATKKRMSEVESEGNLAYLAVADGLAYERMDWPRVYPPSETPSVFGNAQE